MGGNKKKSKTGSKTTLHESNGVPDRVNWGRRGVILSPVQQQGNWAICWALSIAAAVEAAYNIQVPKSKRKALSFQELVGGVLPSKISKITQMSVKNVKDAYKWLQRNGLHILSRAEISDYQLRRGAQQKKKKHSGNTVRIRDFKVIEQVNDDELLEIVSHQPVVALMQVGSEFENFKKDIYWGREVKYRDQLHAVLIVGFGIEVDGTKFWRIRNSYGKQWGKSGYGKVIRKSGANTSIFTSASYPQI